MFGLVYLQTYPLGPGELLASCEPVIKVVLN